ncbi:MAG TPA: hypothetical protein VGG39_27060 [Polyangiaceae bacterium]|jgi:hypothetical protein
MSRKFNSKARRLAEYRAMIEGMRANVSASTPIVVEGVPTSQAEIVGALQGYVDAEAKLAAVEAMYEEALAAKNAAAGPARAAYVRGKACALQTFGQQASVLATFGLAVPVRKAVTAAVNVAAAAKRKVTHAANAAAKAAALKAAVTTTPRRRPKKRTPR